MADVEAAVKKLHRKRRAIKGSITNFVKLLDEWDHDPESRNPDYIQTSLEYDQGSFQKVEDIQDQLEELDETEIAHREVIPTMYNLALARARKYLREGAAPTDNASIAQSMHSNGSSNGMQPIPVKLPTISLPTFDGSVEGWASFYDIFSSLVDKNMDLTPVTKLQYLRLSLTDKAARLTQSLSTTDSNYQIALDLLKNKFDCPRRAMRRHWSILRDYPKLPRDTSQNVGQLVDTFNQHLKALENLGAPIGEWDLPIVDLLLSKISSYTTWQWELTLPNNKLPTYTSLLEFLEKRANSTDLSNPSESERFPKNQGSFQAKNKNFKASVKSAQTFATAGSFKKGSDAIRKNQCVVCSIDHPLYYCSKFKALPVKEKRKLLAEKSLYFNCLRGGHSRDVCKSGSCKHCSVKGHHSLVCDLENSVKSNNVNGSSSFLVNESTSELITTTSVNVLDVADATIRCRALIDTCSTTNFITQRLAQKLGLKRTRRAISVSVLNGETTRSKGTIDVVVRSRCTAYQKCMTFHIVDNISNLVPSQPINRRMLSIPKNIDLADPNFHIPAAVDLLIASGTTLSLLCKGQIDISKNNDSSLILQKTLLGWVIGGSAPSNYVTTDVICHLTTTLDFDLRRFWAVEEGPKTKFFTEEEINCESHFKNNVQRQPDGRYVVALPFNDKKELLGDSKITARKRLQNIEKKLNGNSELKEQYHKVMNEYIALGHMTPVAENKDDSDGVYLPHHAVIKTGSLTSKTRVVFDGSAQTSSGLSLNDALIVGPTIQSDLFTQLIKFRKHRFVMTGDIEMMYRQFLVRPDDRKYQRILWRDGAGQETTYELNTVTFGLSPSSFLAVRGIHQLAADEGHAFPLAAKVLTEEMYVDDALTGAETIRETKERRDQSTKLLQRGGIKIRQWAANAPELLDDLPPEMVNKHLVLKDSQTINTLGVKWNSSSDSINYVVISTNLPFLITKRTVLSEIAKIFDPLGLLVPVITTAKIFIQELWKLKLNWDESLPLALHSKWMDFRSQLQSLNDFCFDRCVLIQNSVRTEVHGFSDASEKAYGACIYLRSINAQGQIFSSLLCAKSRVAPVKTLSIARLELCGALLLTNLICTVKENMGLKFDSITHWTDSTVVLNWLQISPARLKTFVANRVAEIQTRTEAESWQHVRTFDNPADLISRGQMPKEFQKASIWQHGPTWLSQSEANWPSSKMLVNENIEVGCEIKTAQCFGPVQMDTDLLQKYSSIHKLQRVIAYCMRLRKKDTYDKVPSGEELANALAIIMRMVQRTAFSNEIRSLEKGKQLEPQSRLLTLNPFLDNDGLIRVGGRLRNSFLTFNQCHPIILPKSNHVTRLLVENEHRSHAHAGAQATLYALRRQFWILDGKSEVKRILRSCVPCCKMRPPSLEYIMGDLPRARVTPARAFQRSGIDYCGPFLIKEKKHRNRGQQKAYVAIFVCLATKAVHLELVTDYSTDTFIAALKRFFSRRGISTDIFSDNAPNFVGADNQLRELFQLFDDAQHKVKVNSFLVNRNVKWHFIPVRTASFGGIWEAAVKSFKRHLRHVIGKTLLTYEEFSTLIIEIEAILNSRPLTPISPDPNDSLVLSPGHFLIGDSLTSLPTQDFRNVPLNRLSTWQHIQLMRQHFWTRWSKEYLNELNVRRKWLEGPPNIKEGALVLLKDDNAAPMSWKMGRVVACHPGADGAVRVVSVKTPKSTTKIGVRRLAPLPITNE